MSPRQLPSSDDALTSRQASVSGTTWTAASGTTLRKRSSVDPRQSTSQRDLADCPKMTWVTPSRWAKATSPSAGRSALTRTTVAPRLSASRMFCWSASASRELIRSGCSCGYLDVDGVPLRTQAAGDARAGADDTRRQRIRAHAHHHALGNQGRLQSLPLAVAGGLLAHFVGDGTQRQLPQGRQVALAEKVRERLLHLLRLVDLALPVAGCAAPRP